MIDPFRVADMISHRIKSKSLHLGTPVLIHTYFNVSREINFDDILESIVKHLLFKKIKAQCPHIEKFLLKDTNIVIFRKIINNGQGRNIEIWVRRLDRSDVIDKILTRFRVRALALFFGF